MFDLKTDQTFTSTKILDVNMLASLVRRNCSTATSLKVTVTLSRVVRSGYANMVFVAIDQFCDWIKWKTKYRKRA